ncbi:hypothetical protein [uncultured Nocardioides sp.]|uniref:hypothetical protein n=1 Tax=uncultured Nocardioides sp. TaxID=198441 RepID=UPI002613B77B|nr:hypothetical protein [uncultured Nocardioides sp.]
MRRLAVPALLVALALTATPGLGVPAGAAEIPRVQLVKDPGGDVRTSGRVPTAVRRSVDVSSLQVRRDATQLRLGFRLRDVRSFAGYEQGATVLLSRRNRTQRFTVDGSRVLQGDPTEGRVCEDGRAVRKAGGDVLVVRLPFLCIRTTPGKPVDLRGIATATPRGTGGTASDPTRTVRADPR